MNYLENNPKTTPDRFPSRETFTEHVANEVTQLDDKNRLPHQKFPKEYE